LIKLIQENNAQFAALQRWFLASPFHPCHFALTRLSFRLQPGLMLSDQCVQPKRILTDNALPDNALPNNALPNNALPNNALSNNHRRCFIKRKNHGAGRDFPSKMNFGN
jgi:hypothetical protein